MLIHNLTLYDFKNVLSKSRLYLHECIVFYMKKDNYDEKIILRQILKKKIVLESSFRWVVNGVDPIRVVMNRQLKKS